MDHGVIRRNEERFIDSRVSFENDFRVSGTSLGLEVGVWWAERKRLNLLLIPPPMSLLMFWMVS